MSNEVAEICLNSVLVVFYSIATLFSLYAIDNAYDPDVRARELKIELKPFSPSETHCFTFTDDGTGMDADGLHRMLRSVVWWKLYLLRIVIRMSSMVICSFGFCDKVNGMNELHANANITRFFLTGHVLEEWCSQASWTLWEWVQVWEYAIRDRCNCVYHATSYNECRLSVSIVFGGHKGRDYPSPNCLLEESRQKYPFCTYSL